MFVSVGTANAAQCSQSVQNFVTDAAADKEQWVEELGSFGFYIEGCFAIGQWRWIRIPWSSGDLIQLWLDANAKCHVRRRHATKRLKTQTAVIVTDSLDHWLVTRDSWLELPDGWRWLAGVEWQEGVAIRTWLPGAKRSNHDEGSMETGYVSYVCETVEMASWGFQFTLCEPLRLGPHCVIYYRV